MALPALDDFNRSNGTLITGNWSNNGSATGFSITSNKAHPNASGENAARYSGETFDARQYAEGTVSLTGGSYIGVAVRCSADANKNYYGLYADSGSTFFFKVISGVYTGFSSSGAAGIRVVSGDKIRIEADGTTIRPRKNGLAFTSSIVDTTDSALSSGSAGISGYGTSSSATIDDWEGGNLPIYVGPTVTKTVYAARNDPSVGALTTSHTVDTGTALLVCILYYPEAAAGDIAPTMKWGGSGGTTMTKSAEGKHTSGSSSGHIVVYTLANPATGVNDLHHQLPNYSNGRLVSAFNIVGTLASGTYFNIKSGPTYVSSSGTPTAMTLTGISADSIVFALQLGQNGGGSTHTISQQGWVEQIDLPIGTFLGASAYTQFFADSVNTTATIDYSVDWQAEVYLAFEIVGAAASSGPSPDGSYTVTAPLSVPVATLARAAVTGGASLAPSSLSIPITLHAPTASVAVNATVNPSTLSVPVTLLSRTVTGAAAVAPSTLSLPVTLLSRTVTGAAAVAPSTLAVPVATLAPAVTGSATVAASTLAVPAATLSPAVTGGAAAAPSTLSVPISTLAPTVGASSGGTATPAVLALTWSTAVPTVTGSAAIAPAALSLPIALHGPSVGVSASVAPATLTATWSLLSRTVTGSAAVQPGTQQLNWSTLPPTVDGVAQASFTASTLALVWATLGATATGAGTPPPPPAPARPPLTPADRTESRLMPTAARAMSRELGTSAPSGPGRLTAAETTESRTPGRPQPNPRSLTPA